MLNNCEMANKLEQIKTAVISYIDENMSSEFLYNMYRQPKSRAKFKTNKGLNVEFEFYNDYFKVYSKHFERYQYIAAQGQIANKPLKIHLRTSMSDKGTGTIFSGKYGIAFWNVGDENTVPIIKPFRMVLDKKVYIFANKAMKEILPLIDQFSKDILTITPDEETKADLKKQNDTSDETETPESNSAAQIAELEDMRTALKELCSVPNALDSDEYQEELPLTRAMR